METVTDGGETERAQENSSRSRSASTSSSRSVLLIFLALMVNYLGFEHYRRWDFSRDQKYALSDKTKRILDSFKGKTAHHCFLFPKHADHQRRAESANGISVRRQGKIDVEQIDPERNFSRAKELFDKYKVVSGRKHAGA